MFNDIFSLFGSAFVQPKQEFRVKFGNDPFEKRFSSEFEARQAFRQSNQWREPIEQFPPNPFGVKEWK